MSNMANIKHKSKYSGFTIVELIVVIVVIGILAAITLASYNYLTQRASSTATTANVQQYVDALEMYAFEHGTYPDAKEACLGAEPADSYGGCGKYEYIGAGCEAFGIEPGSSAVTAQWSQTFNSSLEKYMGSAPNKVQTSPYKTLVMNVDDCSVFTIANSPTYTSAEWIMIQDASGGTAYPTNSEVIKAFYISYAIDKNEECGLQNSVKQTDLYFGSDVAGCIVYGGDVTFY